MNNKLVAKKQSLWHRIKQGRVAYLMLLPAVVGFVLLTLYPNLWVASLSFFKYDGITNPTFIGLENYVRLFTRDPLWWRAVLNTAVFSVGKLLIEMPLALILAVMLNRKLRGSNLIRELIFLPNVTSAAVMAVVFSLLFSAYNGVINNALFTLGAIDYPIEWLGTSPHAMIVVILVSTWQSIGINTIFFLSGLQGIPEDVYESGDIDGAVGIKRFIYITLPLLARMLQLILMLAIIGSLQMFDIVKVLTAGGPSGTTEVMMTYIYSHFFPSSYAQSVVSQVGYGSALGVIASLIIGVVTSIYLYVSRKMDDIA